jgi:hypothetical protein
MNLDKLTMDELISLRNEIQGKIHSYTDGYLYICSVRQFGSVWEENPSSLYGLKELVSNIISRASILNHYYKPAMAMSLILIATYRLFDWFPYYPAYFNRYNNELQGAIEEGRSFPFVGGIPAIEYLNKIAEKEGDKIVSVTGDISNFRYKYKNINKSSDNLKFGFFSAEFSDYLFVYSSHMHLLPNFHKALISQLTPEYTVQFKGTDLVKVYKLPYGIVNLPYKFNFKKSGRTTGKIKGRSGSEFILTEKDKDSPGFIFFTPGLRLKKGKYEVDVEAEASNFDIKLSKIVEIKLNKACHVMDTKFNVNDHMLLKVICDLYTDNKLSPSIYWPGGYDLQINQIKVRKM